MFVTPNATNNTSNQTPASSKDKAPRTTGAYVNAYIELDDGTRVKLFSDLTLRLFMEKAAEAQLVNLMREGVITPDQAAQLITVEVSLARDENAPININLAKLGIKA